MSGRVIQGYFFSGEARPPLTATTPRVLGPSNPGIAGRTWTAQARALPGGVQFHGASRSFDIDPVQIGIGRGGGTRLPQAVLARMEMAFRTDFSAVRIHIGPQAARIGAVSFTMGDDIYFSPSSYQPNSNQGLQLLGHELAHVVQQRQGRVRGSGHGISVVQDRALEAEADRLGQQAALPGAIQANLAPSAQIASNALMSGGVPLYLQAGRGGGGGAIQRLTAASYSSGVRTANDVIVEVAHVRVMHNDTNRKLAAYLSGYNNSQDAVNDGCRVCNHYVPYSSICSEIIRNIKAQATVGKAVAWMEGLKSKLPKTETFTNSDFNVTNDDWSFTVEGVPAVDFSSVGNVNGVSWYLETNLNKQIDDLIYNLANDPRNLFYWRNSSGDGSGTLIDKPQGPKGTGYATLNTVLGRLSKYHQSLKALGLIV
ncbi:DUF4157 domain-containing protein [Corallococcus sp. AB030]|nr:DUF4157 domain-containing protein [Corallococcus sp. AB030]